MTGRESRREPLDPPEPGLDVHSSVDAVRELYDRWSRVYDVNPVLGLVRPLRRRAVAAMGLAPGDTVVDMGTGTGANLAFLREAVGPTGRVVGVDVSPGMLAAARARVERAGWDNVALVEGDVRRPPLAGPVDGVLSAFVVVMYADPGPLLDAWADLVDGGVVANLYSGPSTRPSAPLVNRLLAGYLRLFEAGWDAGGDGPSPLDVVARRGRLARSALASRATSAAHETGLLGLVQLDVGRFDGSTARSRRDDAG